MKFNNILSNKKGQSFEGIQALPMFVVILVIAAVILVLGIIVLQELRDSQITGVLGAENVTNCTVGDTQGCGEAFSGANLTIVGLGTFADFWTIIVLALVITVVLALLLGMFGGRRIR